MNDYGLGNLTNDDRRADRKTKNGGKIQITVRGAWHKPRSHFFENFDDKRGFLMNPLKQCFLTWGKLPF